MNGREAVASQFKEFRARHAGKGGHSRGLKYPEALRRAAVEHFRAVPGQRYATVASALGVRGTALQRWDREFDGLQAKAAPTPAFVPLKVVPPQPESTASSSRQGRCTISWQQISFDLGPDPDEALVRSIVAALQVEKGGLPR